MLNLITLIALAAGTVLTARHLQRRWQTGSATDALLLAYRSVWPGKPVTWAQLDRRAFRSMLAVLQPGVSGQIVVPTHFVIDLAPADHELVGASANAMAEDLAAALRQRANQKGWRMPTRPTVELRLHADGIPGHPRARARYAGATQDLPADHPLAPTQPMQADDLPTLPATELTTAPEDDHVSIETQPAVRCSLTSPDGLNLALDHRRSPLRVGRDRDADLMLPERTVSGSHAELTFRLGTWWIRDAGSSNGTWVDGNRLGPSEERALEHGASLSFGRTGPTVRFHRVDVDAPAHSERWAPEAR